MNKAKIIIPLLVATPTLFACGSNHTSTIVGKYKVQEASQITYKFIKGDESNFEGVGHTKINDLKKEICKKLISYDEKTTTEDQAIHLESEELAMSGTSITGEQLTLYPVNLRKTSPTTFSEAFEYAKTKNGYRFMISTSGKYDGYVFHYRSETGSNPIEEKIMDNGFKVNGKTLIISMLGQFSAARAKTSHEIEFTITATR